MFVGILTFHILLESSRSLKEKRGQIKPLLNYLHKKFNVSAAEIDYLDSWNKSVLACALIGNERHSLETRLGEIYHYTEINFRNVQFLDYKIEIW